METIDRQPRALPLERARRCGLREAVVVEVALDAVVEDRVTVVLGLSLGGAREQHGERGERERAMSHVNAHRARHHALVRAIPSRIAASSTARLMLRSVLNLMQYPVTLALPSSPPYVSARYVLSSSPMM